MGIDFKNLVGRFGRSSPQGTALDAGSLSARWDRLVFKFSPLLRAEFYEMLAALIKDGKPLDVSIRALRTRYQSKRRSMATLLACWANSLDEGQTIAAAVAGYASDTEALVISATEKAGDLAGGFLQAASVARASADIRGMLVAELTAPVVQVVVLMGMLIGFSLKLAPELIQSVPMEAMDESQKLLFGLSAVIAKTWFLAIPAMVLAMAGVAWTVPIYVGRARRFLDLIPPYSIYKVYNGATFMISLSALIKAGVPIESAIRFIRQQSGPWLVGHLSTMIGRMRAGSEQGEALDTGLLSDRMSDMVAIYSKTSNFDEAISTIGQMAIKDGLRSIKAQAGTVKIAAMLCIAGLVMWIYVAVLGIGDAADRASKMRDRQQQVAAQVAPAPQAVAKK